MTAFEIINKSLAEPRQYFGFLHVFASYAPLDAGRYEIVTQAIIGEELTTTAYELKRAEYFQALLVLSETIGSAGDGCSVDDEDGLISVLEHLCMRKGVSKTPATP